MPLRSFGAFLLLLAGTAGHPPWKGDGDNDSFFRTPPSASPIAPENPPQAVPSTLFGSSPADLGAFEITLARAPENPSSVGYSVVIRGDGSVRFRRFPDLDSRFEQTTRVPTRTVRWLVQQFEMVEGLSSCDEGLPPAAAPPPIWLSLREGVRTRSVCGWTDTPEVPSDEADTGLTELDDRCIALADAIDQAVHIERCIGPDCVRRRRAH